MHSILASENWTITWKRRKIGGNLLLITNRKLHMGFQLVPKWVTLNDLGRRNGHVVCVISLEFARFFGHVKVVKYTQIRFASEM